MWLAVRQKNECVVGAWNGDKKGWQEKNKQATDQPEKSPVVWWRESDKDAQPALHWRVLASETHPSPLAERQQVKAWLGKPTSPVMEG